MKQEQQQTL